MLQGLMHIEDGGKVLPFVRTFHGQSSNFIWEDETGDVHDSPKEEGSEQGDPLMPLLFCLAQHAALRARQIRWRKVNTCSLFWTICTSSVTLIELGRFTPSSNGSCFATPTSVPTWARLRYGTEVATSQRHVHDCKRLLQWWTSQLGDHTLPVSSQGVKIGLRQCSVAGEVRFPFSSTRSCPCDGGYPSRVVAPVVLCASQGQFPSPVCPTLIRRSSVQ